MSGPLDREAILRAFDALSGHLREKGVRLHLYVVGGATMALEHRRSRTTFDVDALMIRERATVLEAAQRVAADQGLPENWLNDDVRNFYFMPPRPDRRASTMYESPNLVVTGASPGHMLAMKLMAGRGSDLEDAAVLLRKLDLRTLAEVREIHREVFPHDGIPVRVIPQLERMLREIAQHGDREGARPTLARGPKGRGRGDSGPER